MRPQFDYDDLASRRAISNLVDSWMEYEATGNLGVLKEEIETSPDPDIARKYLDFAFGNRDLHVLELLEEFGISYREIDDPYGWESLVCDAITSARDCPEVVRWLLDRGASPVRRAENRWSPLHLAAIKNCSGVIGVLLESGVDVDIGTEIDGDWTPLMEACRAGAVDSVRLLLRYGADASRRCRLAGESVSEIARRSGQPEIVAMLEAAAHSNA